MRESRLKNEMQLSGKTQLSTGRAGGYDCEMANANPFADLASVGRH
jgi:hypothetical protein